MKFKELMEKRAQLMEQIEELTNSIEAEKRAFTDEENTKFDELSKEVENIDATIAQMERAQKLSEVDNKPDEAAGTESVEEMEVRAFADFIRNKRSGDSNITKSDNEAVIPKTIVNKIIDKIKDISPLYRDAEKFNIKGTVSIPYVDSENDNITVAYATEFTDLEAKSTKLLTTDLNGYRVNTLVLHIVLVLRKMLGLRGQITLANINKMQTLSETLIIKKLRMDAKCMDLLHAYYGELENIIYRYGREDVLSSDDLRLLTELGRHISHVVNEHHLRGNRRILARHVKNTIEKVIDWLDSGAAIAMKFEKLLAEAELVGPDAGTQKDASVE